MRSRMSQTLGLGRARAGSGRLAQPAAMPQQPDRGHEAPGHGGCRQPNRSGLRPEVADTAIQIIKGKLADELSVHPKQSLLVESGTRALDAVNTERANQLTHREQFLFSAVIPPHRRDETE